VVHRTDFLQILVDACRRVGVELHVDSEVDAVAVEPEGAVVSVGNRRIRGDVVLAADGLRSTLRDRFDPAPPVASGYVAYRGAFPVADLPGGHDGRPLDEVVVYFGPGCHLVQYALRRGEILNTVAVFESPGYREGREDWGGPEELDQVFARCCDAVHQGLQTLWRDRRWPMYDRVPIPRWVDGRLALTGDAAHPMLQYLAQGACQAVEDAQSLATIARGSSPEAVDWTTALAAFEGRRTVRTARVQLAARTWGEMWHVDGVARLLRNELFSTRAVDDFTHIDWLYGVDPA
jgi:salicylate hydroxylase